MFIKKLLPIIFIFFVIQAGLCDETIKAQNNAYRHNNKGLIYLEEKYYYGAIKEFQIAIDLTPDTQAASVFYINLGKTYELIGYNELAKPCFEKAVSLNMLCFDNYLKLAENYKKLGIADKKLEEFKADKRSPLNSVIVGLLYIQTGKIQTGITVLDDFCNKEPNLLITAGVKNYIKDLTEKSQ